jgi:hypothetical protein
VLASLNHSNIAAICGAEQIDSRHFLVMELVSGETLADRIKRGAIPIEEALPIAKQIAEALEEAHEKGIIHRDLKPGSHSFAKRFDCSKRAGFLGSPTQRLVPSAFLILSLLFRSQLSSTSRRHVCCCICFRPLVSRPIVCVATSQRHQIEKRAATLMPAKTRINIQSPKTPHLT